jgi:NTE family protein
MIGLVLSGGGSRGSWQAGALLYLGENNVLPGGVDYLSCTSVGGINGTGISSFPRSEFKKATQHVADLWRTKVTKTSDIWMLRFPVGIPALWKPSIGTNWPLKKLLEDVVDLQDVGKNGELRLTAVDLESGELKLYTEHDVAIHGLKPILATSSFPGVFPPEEIDGRFETDGGVRDVAPLGAAIKSGCKQIIVLPTQDPNVMDRVPRSKLKNALQVGKRVIDIMSHEVLQNDIRTCKKINSWLRAGWLPPESGMQHVELAVIYPSSPLADSLDFSGDVMKRQIDQGYEDARKHFEG